MKYFLTRTSPDDEQPEGFDQLIKCDNVEDAKKSILAQLIALCSLYDNNWDSLIVERDNCLILLIQSETLEALERPYEVAAIYQRNDEWPDEYADPYHAE